MEAFKIKQFDFSFSKVNYFPPLKFIMITCPCNEDPLTPHFYIVKLGFTGVYTIFLFLL